MKVHDNEVDLVSIYSLEIHKGFNNNALHCVRIALSSSEPNTSLGPDAGPHKLGEMTAAALGS